MPGISTLRRAKNTGPARKRKTFAKKVKDQILMMSEKKYHNASQSPTQEDYAWGVANLSSVAQGDGDTTRDGDVIRGRYLDIRYGWIVSDATNFTRLVILRWKSNTTITAAQVFTQDSHANTVMSEYHHDNRKLFDILHDRTYALSTAGPACARCTARIPLKNKEIQFEAASTTYVKGGIYLFAASDSGAASHPTLQFRSRIHFSDI